MIYLRLIVLIAMLIATGQMQASASDFPTGKWCHHEKGLGEITQFDFSQGLNAMGNHSILRFTWGGSDFTKLIAREVGTATLDEKNVLTWVWTSGGVGRMQPEQVSRQLAWDANGNLILQGFSGMRTYCRCDDAPIVCKAKD